MDEERDWRLDVAQEPSFYSKFTWELKEWTQTRAHWDHDHCEFCGTEISNVVGPEVRNKGWTNEDEYYWICETCFDDFKDMYTTREVCRYFQVGSAWLLASYRQC